ncbi:unnamed protein product [Protopolystoma xenopodis]|uniref:Uncharacterized protein n=1 Tax=Protopolystoma xenopodis TaxID=117903 RepID=A0A3S5B5L2_9PLAT|nr:unnamed protein product [Protopolystoma xenopodis]
MGSAQSRHWTINRTGLPDSEDFGSQLTDLIDSLVCMHKSCGYASFRTPKQANRGGERDHTGERTARLHVTISIWPGNSKAVFASR